MTPLPKRVAWQNRQLTPRLDFEATFAPEIALFAPPQPAREPVSTPSPTWRGSTPGGDKGPQWTSVAVPVNGVKAEEATVIRQITPRQRGAARLSFLGGKKKESSPGQEGADQVNGNGPDVKAHTRGLSKDSGLHSISRSQVADQEAPGHNRGVSLDLLSRSGVEAEAKKNKSVRKRFSLLKLGMKHSKTGAMMGSLDEE